MSAIDDLLAHNADYAAHHDGSLAAPPRLQVAVLTCMDARIDVYRVLGLTPGDAHVLRNAGGLVTDDTIRSLAVSQRLLGTRSVLVVRHSECGMLGLSDHDFRASIEAETGAAPGWTAASLTDLEADTRRDVAALAGSPFLPHVDDIRGFVFDVRSGRLREV